MHGSRLTARFRPQRSGGGLPGASASVADASPGAPNDFLDAGPTRHAETPLRIVTARTALPPPPIRDGAADGRISPRTRRGPADEDLASSGPGQHANDPAFNHPTKRPGASKLIQKGPQNAITVREHRRQTLAYDHCTNRASAFSGTREPPGLEQGRIAVTSADSASR
jgi:hypothetical protein